MQWSELDIASIQPLGREEPANPNDPPRSMLFETRVAPNALNAGTIKLQSFVHLSIDDRTNHPHPGGAEGMTIHETSFFRDVRPFDALRERVIPSILERNAGDRTLYIWSAACSTGQEAYSLAMLLLEHFPELAEWRVKIVGSDVSRHAIDYARRGRYRRTEINRGLPATMLLKYFERKGEEWVVSQRARDLCEFRCANLGEPLPSMTRFDMVLLRNVLLYFPEQGRSGVFSSVYRQMKPKGYLLLGDSEQAEDSTAQFEVEYAGDSHFYRPKGL